jgi:serine/threonine protein kinase
MTTNRIPFSDGAVLQLDGKQYIVRSVIGYGGSCLAYIAERGSDSVVIKEFYPDELATVIERNDSCLCAPPGKQEIFDQLKDHFAQSAKNTVAFYGGDSNHALPPANVFAANGTAYSVVPLTQGKTLAKTRGMTVYETAQAMISVCNAIEKLHAQGKLYLDVKPDNIFLFNKEQGETRRIALFDLDTVKATNDIWGASIPFSPGWAAYEQEHSVKKDISPATDIYSLGATFYWLVYGAEVSGDILTDIETDEFAFLDNCESLRALKNARTQTEKILAATLRYSPSDRVQTVAELKKMFVDLKDHSQPNEGALSDEMAKLREAIEANGAKQASGNSSADIQSGAEVPLRSREHYNLFVFGNKSTYAGTKFVFENDKKDNRVLTEYITDAVRDKFGDLSDSVLAQIKTFPCLFLNENNGDPEQEAYYGFIDEIAVMDNGINVCFQKAAAVRQKDLRDVARSLAIENLEFTRTHWTIKRVNLAEDLTDAGVIREPTPPDAPLISQTLENAGFGSVFISVPHSETFGLIDERTCLKR